MDPILQQEEQRRLRVQLAWRLGFAILLIVGVLGVMIWLDREREVAQTAPEASFPMRIAPPVTIASEILPAIASEPETASTPIEASTTEAASAPVASTTEEESALAISPTSTPKADPTARQQTVLATTPLAHAPAAPSRPVMILPQKPSANPPARPAPPSRPATPANPPVSASQYTIQAGSFLHASNAEKLLRQLQSAGIPAYLETRVQIGPFANKAEAETATAQLRKMGINPVVYSNR